VENFIVGQDMRALACKAKRSSNFKKGREQSKQSNLRASANVGMGHCMLCLKQTTTVDQVDAAASPEASLEKMGASDSQEIVNTRFSDGNSIL
jgi:hypothetical protein